VDDIEICALRYMYTYYVHAAEVSYVHRESLSRQTDGLTDRQTDKQTNEWTNEIIM